MVVLAGVLIAVFAVVALFVLVGDAAALGDGPVHEWVLELRTEPLTTIATAITHAGGSAGMWSLALLVCTLLLWRGARADAALVAAVGGSVTVLVPLSKHLVGRSRPPVGDRLVEVTGPAFPSGHSAGSAAVLGVLAALLLLRTRRRTAARVGAALAAVFAVSVGLSRIYLGVHWPTDVLAGWTLGAVVVVLAVLVWRRTSPPPPPIPPQQVPGQAAGPVGTAPSATVASG